MAGGLVGVLVGQEQDRRGIGNKQIDKPSDEQDN